MNRRGVRVTVLCEDDAHKRFARYAFLRLGYHRREIRELHNPSGRGSAEQWVREHYANEVRTHRSRGASQQVVLVVIVDADTQTVQQRHQQLENQLQTKGLRPRSETEPIVIWVPKRHIETWVAWLSGRDVNEKDHNKHHCKRLVHDQDWKCAAERFVDIFRAPNDRPEGLLPSMLSAIEEMARLPM